MKTYIILALLMTLILLFSSCSTPGKTSSEMRMDNQSMVGRIAPNITYMDTIGQSHRLSSSYGDATVITFVDKHSSDSNSDINKMINDLPEDVSVIEISMQGENANVQDQVTLIKSRYTQGRNIIAISDNQGLIPSKFRNAKTNSVYLLDKNGVIRQQGKISQLSSFKKNIRSIKDDARKEKEELYSGG